METHILKGTLTQGSFAVPDSEKNNDEKKQKGDE